MYAAFMDIQVLACSVYVPAPSPASIGQRFETEGAHLDTALAPSLRDMGGARRAPASARPQKGGSPNTRAAVRGRWCCGWGQPRSYVNVKLHPNPRFS